MPLLGKERKNRDLATKINCVISAYLRESKIQPFTEKHSERILNTKIKNFKIALQESQHWINSKGTSPSEPFIPIEDAESPVASPSTTPHETTSPPSNSHSITQPPATTSPIIPPHRSPSPPPPTIKPPEHLPNPPDQVPIVDIPLSTELAKIWDGVELDEDTVDGFTIISSEKDMSPVVSFYNEHKRKLAIQAALLAPKRIKTDSPANFPKTQPRVESHSAHLHTTPPPPPHIPPQPVHTSHFPLFSQSTTLQKGAPISRHTFKGAATNGFAAVPLHGAVEGSEEGLHVEFTVQGHTYRGFLLARESFPALVSPLVPPISPPPYTSGYPPYVNLAKMTAVAVTKQHQERLVDLGRLVVASAMVPYAYPPSLHL